MIPPPPRSTLFPYTTLFRSMHKEGHVLRAVLPDLDVAGRRVELRGRRNLRQVERLGQPVLVHRSEEHTSELQSPYDLVCRLLLEKKIYTMTRNNRRKHSRPE